MFEGWCLSCGCLHAGDSTSGQGRYRTRCQRIQQLREQDLSWQKVSDLLNEEQVPTGQGRGRWYPASARTALVAYERDRDHVRLHPQPERPAE